VIGLSLAAASLRYVLPPAVCRLPSAACRLPSALCPLWLKKFTTKATKNTKAPSVKPHRPPDKILALSYLIEYILTLGAMGLPKGEVVRISSKGQVVIPKDIRDAFRLRVGAELVVRGGVDSIVMVPVQSYTDMLKRLGKSLTRNPKS
jgi:AbrB family looped-hinge helix DNA binding protein